MDWVQHTANYIDYCAVILTVMETSIIVGVRKCRMVSSPAALFFCVQPTWAISLDGAIGQDISLRERELSWASKEFSNVMFPCGPQLF